MTKKKIFFPSFQFRGVFRFENTAIVVTLRDTMIPSYLVLNPSSLNLSSIPKNVKFQIH